MIILSNKINLLFKNIRFELNQFFSNYIGAHIPINATKAAQTARNHMNGHRNRLHPVANPAVIINQPMIPMNESHTAVVP